ncbi:cytochrome P450 [Mycena leptocephala]|nr:cytochrome P450 [Mycena leptocephala]
MAIMLTLALGLLVLCAAIWLSKVGTREAGLPPGPPTLPIIGNLHIFPTEFSHYKFTEWARKWGGMYSFKVGPSTELMDRRSATTADSPPLHIPDRTAGGMHMVFARYTQTWKTLRKTAATILTPHATGMHLPIQRAESTQLLHAILHSPQSFYTEIQRYSYSVVLSVLYGKRAPRYETPEITCFFNALHEWRELLAGATPPVDALPILKYIPERWAKWKRNSKRVRTLQRELYFGLLEETKARLGCGEEDRSYVEEVLARREELGMDDEMTAYFSGALSLILALVAYPEVQKKAHEEIDSVVGKHRMPSLEDLEHMPYIRAMILETHRFRPVAPLIPPHATLASEEVRRLILSPVAVLDIADLDFIPDRHILTEHGTKLGEVHLRRTCPGIHLAQNSINLNAMNLVWAFNFHPDIDADGNPVPANTFAYTKGISTSPEPFKCRITPRATGKAKIIERELLEAADTFSKFEIGLGTDDKQFLAQSREHH